MAKIIFIKNVKILSSGRNTSILMNIKNGNLNVPKHGNKHDLIHFVTDRNEGISLTHLLFTSEVRKLLTSFARCSDPDATCRSNAFVLVIFDFCMVLRCFCCGFFLSLSVRILFAFDILFACLGYPDDLSHLGKSYHLGWSLMLFYTWCHS